MSWDDFSNAGFSRTDAPLDGVLQFSAPIAKNIESWPDKQEEMRRRLRKAQKALPTFGWDTNPVLGTEEWVEEAFVDVFCDLVYGAGWMDTDRTDEVERECNWALVEFKSMPVSARLNTHTNGHGPSSSPAADPRNGTLLVLFEEFVPAEYRQQLATAGVSTKRKINFLNFSLSGLGKKDKDTSSKNWKPPPPPATLNGRPYTPGAVPAPPSSRDIEFERMMSSPSATRLVAPSRHQSTITRIEDERAKERERVEREGRPPMPPMPSISGLPTTPTRNASALGALQTQTQSSTTITGLPHTNSSLATPTKPSITIAPPPIISIYNEDDSPITPGRSAGSASNSRRNSRFRMPGASPLAAGGKGMVPAESERLEFDMRPVRASDSDEDPATPQKKKRRERERSEDEWVDILVANNERRMQGQDVVPRSNGNGHPRDGGRSQGMGLRTTSSGPAGRSDPDLASQEVAAALKAVEALHLSDDEDDGRSARTGRTSKTGRAGSSFVDLGADVEVFNGRAMSAGMSQQQQQQRPSEDRDGESVRTGGTITEPETGTDGEMDEDDTGAHAALERLRKRTSGTGYFAVHPDRAKSVTPSERPMTTWVDPRETFENDSDDEGDDAGALAAGRPSVELGRTLRDSRDRPMSEATQDSVDSSPYGGLENVKSISAVTSSPSPPPPAVIVTPLKPATRVPVPALVEPVWSAPSPPSPPNVAKVAPLGPRARPGGAVSPPKSISPSPSPLTSPQLNNANILPSTPVRQPGAREMQRSPSGGAISFPSAPVTPEAASNANSNESANTTPSKTASLINMYREKEKEKERGRPEQLGARHQQPAPAAVAPLNPSRIPVRPGQAAPAPMAMATAGTLGAGATPVRTPAEALAPPKVARSGSASPVRSPESSVPMPMAAPVATAGQGPALKHGSSPLANEVVLTPPAPVWESRKDTPSPQRYVHGAPLQNVLEEEEEE